MMRCQVCGCTDADCSGCVERTGRPCTWVAPQLCSACAADPVGQLFAHGRDTNSFRAGGRWLPHRHLRAGFRAARVLAALRAAGLVVSYGTGRHRHHALTPAGLVVGRALQQAARKG